MADFFVSYNKADKSWAEWVAWVLEEDGRYSTVIQAWDFRPGANFVLEMQRAAAECERTIAILSDAYLQAVFTQSEWTNAFRRDPTGRSKGLVPVRVQQCSLDGLLAAIVYVDLVGLDADQAQVALLEGVQSGRIKPQVRPPFPGNVIAALKSKPAFPGADVSHQSSVTARDLRQLAAPPKIQVVAEPARYGPPVVERPLNLGFDGSAPGGLPLGWFNSFGHVSGVSTDYEIRTARRSQDGATGTCVVLEKEMAAPGEFGSLMQRCPGRRLAGRTLRMEGDLRTENVSGRAGLWLRADGADEPNLFFDNMLGRPITGTTTWTRYCIDAPLPKDTEWINYGILLTGAGVLSADNIRLLVWTPDGRWEDV